ncbi:MAG: adenylosuccinate synthase [Flavobacteriaceae bacterium]|jgi:adenylosuccinate synthase|nr:adenylosuccinate synthase [Flavobacteriaceae bacterium]MBT4113351.1 adenylosuccinate synthase [Flavobacteriaceae bacterium]MBT4614758.1 adenylosuccinate synthase [Flavobacteriaceae bacterium]MBT5247044.1 adenylosuccinate synthase [Flavobacteriaceae bacterium]MBT5649700.1 adenylosuccinate synthase [Flavobacteriaceae bacterium]
MSIDLLLGLQWGDEGKGKIVDVLTSGYKIIARFQGGPNAGHTLVFNGKTHVLHTIPSGIFHKNKINIIGNGVVIDPVILRNELKNLDAEGIDYKKSLLISRKAHLILPTHRLLDAASEKSKGKNKIGSTLKGIGPAYMDKTGRNGFRVGDLESENWKEKYSELKSKHKRLIDYYNVSLDYNFDDLEKEFFESIKNLKDLNFIDSEEYIQQEQNKGNSILAEGAQGSLLDIDFGTYPFVTSSNTTAAGACTGLGVSPNSIKEVFGIFKAYTTRVGSGPFPTELFDSNGERMGKVGNEFGATTGRSRRCGWLDLVALKYSCQINGVTKLMMMKSDVLSGFKSIKVCTSYEYKAKEIRHMPYDISDSSLKPIYEEFEGWDDDITRINDFDKLPVNLKKYISYIEKVLNIPITVISVGPDRLQTIIV